MEGSGNDFLLRGPCRPVPPLVGARRVSVPSPGRLPVSSRAPGTSQRLARKLNASPLISRQPKWDNSAYRTPKRVRRWFCRTSLSEQAQSFLFHFRGLQNQPDNDTKGGGQKGGNSSLLSGFVPPLRVLIKGKRAGITAWLGPGFDGGAVAGVAVRTWKGRVACRPLRKAALRDGESRDPWKVPLMKVTQEVMGWMDRWTLSSVHPGQAHRD